MPKAKKLYHDVCSKKPHIVCERYTYPEKVKRNDDMVENTFICNNASASWTQEVDV